MINPFILTLTICLLFAFLWLRRGKRLPPGPIRFPVLGSVIQIYHANPLFPHLAFSKLAKKYGDIMTLGFGTYTAVVISSYELLQEVFKKIETSSTRFKFPYVTDRNYGKNLGIIWGSGQKWVDVRRYTKKILNEFGYSKVKIMDESLNDSANQLVDCIKTELLDSSDNTVFIDHHMFSVHVLNIIWNLAGGYKFNPNDPDLLRNMECVDKFSSVLGHKNPYNLFPFLKTWLPSYAEHLKIHNEIHEFTESLVNDARERRSQRPDSEPISFIEVFLDKIDENAGDPDSVYTHEQLLIIIEDLFLGGLETTGTLLAWSMFFLVFKPDVQAKLRKVILDKMENRTNFLTPKELKAIPYLKATILEIIRLGNIVPMPAPRSTTRDVQIGDYIIPKGAVLFYNLYPMYQDKSIWDDPKEFKPERFINESGTIDQTRSERILNSVFGLGPRICFGETAAIDSLFMFLTAVIVNFKLDTVPGQELSVDNPHTGIIIAPQKFRVKISSPSKH